MNSKLKILYVDDEEINRVLFKHNFSKKYDVHSVSSGSSGLEALAKDPDITVVISDWKMPRMNGLEFIQQAKEKFPEKKYFMLSGMEITPEIETSLESGLIINYFCKPYDEAQMEAELDQLIVK